MFVLVSIEDPIKVIPEQFDQDLTEVYQKNILYSFFSRFSYNKLKSNMLIRSVGRSFERNNSESDSCKCWALYMFL
jgi:DNA-directed RNA polymerase subunit E'/Rpb7